MILFTFSMCIQKYVYKQESNGHDSTADTVHTVLLERCRLPIPLKLKSLYEKHLYCSSPDKEDVETRQNTKHTIASSCAAHGDIVWNQSSKTSFCDHGIFFAGISHFEIDNG